MINADWAGVMPDVPVSGALDSGYSASSMTQASFLDGLCGFVDLWCPAEEAIGYAFFLRGYAWPVRPLLLPPLL